MSEFGGKNLAEKWAYFQLGKMLGVLAQLGFEVNQSHVRSDGMGTFEWYVSTAKPVPTWVGDVFKWVQRPEYRAFQP